METMTEQESFWKGSFGDAYIERNSGAELVESNRLLFQSILTKTGPLDSVVEFGCNVGLNLIALHQLLPDADLHGIEINAAAASQAKSALPSATVTNGSILEYEPSRQFDIAFTKGVMIHLPPESLPSVYAKLHASSRKYIFMAEFYNPTPIEISYRGHSGKLFKRDFAGELLDKYSDVQLVDYGFVWRRDPHAPQDDLTWFLLQKSV